MCSLGDERNSQGVQGNEGDATSDGLLPDGPDSRIAAILRLIMQLAHGELRARGKPSPAADDLDGVLEGLNMLAEELEHSTVSAKAYRERTRELEQTVKELAETQRLLQELADLDPLTRLPNRRVFDDRLEMMLHRCKRENKRAAVLYVDIDCFKPVNDRYGHAMGDRVLIEIGSRLKQRLRETDTAGRLGGDEFALLLDLGPSDRDTAEIAERILTAIRAPIEVNGVSIEIGASIGIAFFPDDGETVEQLIQAADNAMYLGKRGPEPILFASHRSHKRIAVSTPQPANERPFDGLTLVPS